MIFAYYFAFRLKILPAIQSLPGKALRLERHLQGVRHLPFHSQNDINLGAFGQVPREHEVGLIQTDEFALLTGECHLHTRSAYGRARAHLRGRGTVTESGAEENQKEIVARRSHIIWDRDEFLLRVIEAKDRFVYPRVIRFYSEDIGGGHAFTVLIRRKDARRYAHDIQSAYRDFAIAGGGHRNRRAVRRARRYLELGLRPRHVKETCVTFRPLAISDLYFRAGQSDR